MPKSNYEKETKKIINADVQADFWNGDPDIDAMCRMEYAPECKFENKYFPIASNKMSPFNSQNTFISKKILKDYFLFPGVGRMDDIWAAFYVQAKGYKVVYNSPSVYQLRNKHDLTKDMKAEFLGYEHNLSLVSEICDNPEIIDKYLPKNAIKAFKIYKSHFEKR